MSRDIRQNRLSRVDGAHINVTCVTVYYSVPVGERSIAISLSDCLSVREHISGIAGPTFTKFFVPIPCGRGSIFLWRRCDTLCTSGFIDNVTFGVVGRMALAALRHRAQSDVYECLVDLDLYPIYFYDGTNTELV